MAVGPKGPVNTRIATCFDFKKMSGLEMSMLVERLLGAAGAQIGGKFIEL